MGGIKLPPGQCLQRGKSSLSPLETSSLMKALVGGLLALSFLSLAAADAQAQIIVRVRPARPKVVVARPVAPSPRHVWVEEEWAPAGAGYQWRGGYWAAPPRERAIWVPGHWTGRRRGYTWVPGHWR